MACDVENVREKFPQLHLTGNRSDASIVRIMVRLHWTCNSRNKKMVASPGARDLKDRRPRRQPDRGERGEGVRLPWVREYDPARVKGEKLRLLPATPPSKLPQSLNGLSQPLPYDLHIFATHSIQVCLVGLLGLSYLAARLILNWCSNSDGDHMSRTCV